MPTIIDNTGIESIATVAGLIWVKTKYPSYENYRSPGFFVGQTPKGFWALHREGSKNVEIFPSARAAQVAAAMDSDQGAVA